MKYFIDTEFIEGTQKSWFGRNTKPTIDLISIGIVAEDGREYYAISKDFNLKEAWNRWQQRTGQGDRNNIEPKEYWIRENVLKPIYNELNCKENEIYNTYPYNNFDEFNYKSLKWLINKYGKSNKQIAKEIKQFITYNNSINYEKQEMIIEKLSNPKFYGYYADYDWVVFCWLFGKMTDLPENFPMYCIDLKQTLDEKAFILLKNIEMFDATSDLNFSNSLKFIKSRSDFPKQTNEHNALADARWNFELYKFLNNLF